MEKDGSLIPVATIFKLSCAPDCPFNLECAKQFKNGQCVKRIEKNTREDIYGTPSKMVVRGKNIIFTTANPSGDISISDGWVNISR